MQILSSKHSKRNFDILFVIFDTIGSGSVTITMLVVVVVLNK